MLPVFKGAWASADGRSPTAREGAGIALLGTSLIAPARQFVFADADADADFAGRLVDWAGPLRPWVRPSASSVNPQTRSASQFCPADGSWNGRLTRPTAHRHLARDYERDPATGEDMIRWAAIGLTTRRRPG